VTGLVWLTVPLMVLAFSAIVGIPMWLTFQRPETYPDYAEARAHDNARREHVAAVAAGQPADSGLSLARQHAAAQEPVPGRRHAAGGRPARPGRLPAGQR